MNKQTLKRAIETFGAETQVEIAIEEMAELIKALQKLKRYEGNYIGAEYELLTSDVVDEVADVKIMMEQLSIMFGEKAVNERVEFKLNRLQTRLDNIKK